MYILKVIRRSTSTTALTAPESTSDQGTGVSLVALVLARLDEQLASRPALKPLVEQTLRSLVEREMKFIRKVVQTEATVRTDHTHKPAAIEAYVSLLTAMFTTLIEALPPESPEAGVLLLQIPLISLLRDPNDVLQRLAERSVSHHFDGGILTLGAGLARDVVKRLCRVSGVREDEARKRPARLKWPRQLDLSPISLAEAFFAGTPLGDLMLTPIDLKVSDRLRMEHCLITGASGHGKSQTFEHMIAADLDRPKGQEVGLVVIDSQGDLIDRIARRSYFAGNDRLLIVDAADVGFPVGSNLFDLGGASLSSLSVREREQTSAAMVQLYEYVIGGLFGAEMTQKQSTVFRFLIRLMLSIEGATIHTLRQCLEEPQQFVDAMERQPETAQQFFRHEYMAKHFSETRKQILRRLYDVLQNPVFERMFASPKNRIDLGKALDEGRVVLCNTSRAVLQEECSLFGRYCIALALKAAIDRGRRPAHQRRPSYLYIDDAGDYFDDHVGQLLVHARKYNLGLVLAHQTLDQMGDALRAIVMSNTGIKLAGGVSSANARALAPELRSTADFILEQTKRSDSTEFAAYIRNLTPSAVCWRVPFFGLDRMKPMPEKKFADLLARNRMEVSGLQ